MSTTPDTLEVGPMNETKLETLEEYMDRMAIFIKNRQAIPLEELDKYAGQWVAWAPDGSRIVASTDDELVLNEKVIQAGFDPQLCVISFMGAPGHFQ
jgi:hypothetical protein